MDLHSSTYISKNSHRQLSRNAKLSSEGEELQNRAPEPPPKQRRRRLTGSRDYEQVRDEPPADYDEVEEVKRSLR